MEAIEEAMFFVLAGQQLDHLYPLPLCTGTIQFVKLFLDFDLHSGSFF
jgi:hypothetical protein